MCVCVCMYMLCVFLCMYVCVQIRDGDNKSGINNNLTVDCLVPPGQWDN